MSCRVCKLHTVEAIKQFVDILNEHSHSWTPLQKNTHNEQFHTCYVRISYFISYENRKNEDTVPYHKTPESKFPPVLCGSWLEQPSSLSWHTEYQGTGGCQSAYTTWIMKYLRCLYSFSMCSHLAITGSWLSKCSDSNCTLRVHFKRCGASYFVAVAWFWNWKNGSLHSFMALTLLVPLSHTVATTCSPTFWQALRTSFKKCTSISALVLPRLRW